MAQSPKTTSGRTSAHSPDTKRDTPNSPGIAWFGPVLLVLAIALAFSPCLSADFVNWDDDVLVTNNPAIRNLDPSAIARVFTSAPTAVYIPLPLLSFTIDRALFGLDPRAFHATNLLLHALNAVLALFVIRSLTRRPLAAFLGALLFAIHPLRVESVAWVTERKDVLCVSFLLAATLAYLRYRAAGRWKWWGISLALFVLALFSKGLAAMFPIVLILIDYYQKRRVDKNMLWDKVPFLVLALTFGGIALAITGRSSSNPYPIPLLFRPFVASHVLLLYLSKSILPLRLSAFYTIPPHFQEGLPLLYWVAPGILAVLVAAVLWWGRWSRTLVFGSMLFILLAAPFTHIVPWANRALAGDRFTYLPSLGLAFLGGVGLAALWDRWGRRNASTRTTVWAIASAGILALGVLTYQRCKVWKNSETLWSDVIANDPDNVVAWTNRGNYFMAGGNYDKSRRDYSTVLQLTPAEPEAWVARGNLFVATRQLSAAQEDFAKALELDPKNYNALLGRGTLYAQEGDLLRAEADFTQAISLKPKDASGYVNRGNVYANRRQLDLAMRDYRTALDLDPYNAQAHDNLGLAFSLQGDNSAALDHYTQALRCDPAFLRAWLHRGNLQMKLGQVDAAIEDYTLGLKQIPRSDRLYCSRGVAFMKKGDRVNALRDFDRALAVNPSNSDAAQYRRDLVTAEERGTTSSK